MDQKFNQDRFRGCLLGLAIGDALGTTLEFKSPGSFAPITDIVGGGPFKLEPGQWTDDTSMALCLAESLIQKRGFDVRHQMELYVRWWQDGYLSSNGTCFDIGNTIVDSLTRFRDTGDPLAGSTHPESAGNGSLMRLAPVPMLYADDVAKAIEYSALSSRTTHGSTEAVDACRLYSILLVHALCGASKETLTSSTLPKSNQALRDEPLCESIEAIARGSFRRLEPPAIKGSGYVVNSLEAALWAFDRSTTFRDGALLAVNLGDDADTTGAIYGQIAGAYYGANGIPASWLERLTMVDEITSYADALFDLAHEGAT